MCVSGQGKSPSKLIYKVKENVGQKDPEDGLCSKTKWAGLFPMVRKGELNSCMI